MIPFSLILFILACSLSAAESTRPPNILFIFADDWGWGDLGCHGHPDIKTPVLDQMAKQGSNFHQFTVASGVCSPSRTAMLTGHFPARYRINRHFASIDHHRRSGMPDWLDPQAPMLPRILKSRGYSTHHFGKWHLTNTHIPDAPDPTLYGYDEAAVFNGPGKQGTPDNIFDHAIRVIEQAREKPFFINLWIHETHTPHYPKPEYLDRYKHLGDQERVYAAVVSHADFQIGRVLGALDKAGLANETIVIFSSDNGPENTGGENRKQLEDASTGPGMGTYYSTGATGGLKGRKRSLHEGGVRVPLLVRWPGKIPAGRIDKTSVITGVDWFVTLCSIAGAELPGQYEPDGEDRSSVLMGESTGRRKPIFWLWPSSSKRANWPYAAVRSGKWKLLRDRKSDRIELYDIPSDRGENHNLAGKHPELVRELSEQLENWLSDLPTEPNSACFSKQRQPGK